jgi:hypothetical protein
MEPRKKVLLYRMIRGARSGLGTGGPACIRAPAAMRQKGAQVDWCAQMNKSRERGATRRMLRTQGRRCAADVGSDPAGQISRRLQT